MKTAKILKVLFGTAVVGLTGYFIHKEYKKQVKKQEEQDRIRENKLAEVGINKDRFDRDMVPGKDDDNLEKALFICVRSNSDIDDDAIDIQNCIDNENVIHIRQSGARDNGSFDYLLEIPESATNPEQGNYHFPRINDFLRSFKTYKLNLEQMTGRRVFTNLEGYFIVKFKQRGHADEKLGVAAINKMLYSQYADDHHDGLVDYITDIRNNNLQVDLSGLDIDDDFYDIKVIDVRLLFKFSFNRKDLDIKTSYDILKYLRDEVKVYRGKNTNLDNLDKGYSYDYIMFNTLGPAGNWSLLHYYTKCEDTGKIISDFFTYEEEKK